MIIQIVPDYSLTNSGLDALLTNIHQYQPLLKRLKSKTLLQDPIVFEILISKTEKSFYLLIPDYMQELVLNELNNCYPKSTFKTYGKIDYNQGAIKYTDHMINVLKVNEFVKKAYDAV